MLLKTMKGRSMVPETSHRWTQCNNHHRNQVWLFPTFTAAPVTTVSKFHSRLAATSVLPQSWVDMTGSTIPVEGLLSGVGTRGGSYSTVALLSPAMSAATFPCRSSLQRPNWPALEVDPHCFWEAYWERWVFLNFCTPIKAVQCQ